MVSSAPFFFFFFLPAAVISSFTMTSAPFFFFFFLPAVDRSSLLTTVPGTGAANTGVRLVEPRNPSAAIIAVNLRMMDILIVPLPGKCGPQTCNGAIRRLTSAQTPPYHVVLNT
jgi:hypothetical protein